MPRQLSWQSKGLKIPLSAVRFHLEAPYGQIPERPNGSDCKSDVSDFGGSNPPLSTRKETPVRCLFLVVQVVRNPPYLRWLARGAKNKIVRINSTVFERRHFGSVNPPLSVKKGYLYGYPFSLFIGIFVCKNSELFRLRVFLFYRRQGNDKCQSLFVLFIRKFAVHRLDCFFAEI